MRVNVRLTTALAIAAAGLVVGVATGDYASGGFGAVRPPSSATASSDGVAPEALSDRLAEIRRSLAIRADQETAWQDYADAMRYLDQATHDFEQRRAEGGAQDDQMERSRHALLLGAAIGDLQKSLSPAQFARARRLTEDLASSVTCVGLRGS